MPQRSVRLLSLLALFVFSTVGFAAEPAPLEFRLQFDKAAHAQPFTGRIYVLLTKQETKELPAGFNWLKPEPAFILDVKDWKPGQPLVLGADAFGFPLKLADLPKATYSVHAVMDLDRGGRHFSTADGNVYSAPVRRELDPRTAGPIELVLNQTYRDRPFVENERVKLVDIESKRLTEFHKRPVRLRAGVVLPKTYAANPDSRYPVVYEVPGFGGNHFAAFAAEKRDATDVAGVEMLHVVLDPACRLGHHVFADSDNNGPYGKALTEELIPHIEAKYRAIGKPSARFVTGHSSGGWSSLWLQVAYPDFFGGTWSTAPDPVDFRDFSGINVYREGENAFTVDASRARSCGPRMVLLHVKPFSDMEEAMGHGGQFGSFEAVFSPRGSDGKPKRLWDRVSGKIDPEVAKTWRYDIRLVLERSWKTRSPKPAARSTSTWVPRTRSTWMAHGAAEGIAEQARQRCRGRDFPGKDHGSLMDKARERIAKEMAAAFRNKK